MDNATLDRANKIRKSLIDKKLNLQNFGVAFNNTEISKGSHDNIKMINVLKEYGSHNDVVGALYAVRVRLANEVKESQKELDSI